MRPVQLLAVAALSIALAPSANAKDITLTLSDQEQQALVQVLDKATRDGGLAAAQNNFYFYEKLQKAVTAANAHAPAADNAPPAPAAPGEQPQK